MPSVMTSIRQRVLVGCGALAVVGGLIAGAVELERVSRPPDFGPTGHQVARLVAPSQVSIDRAVTISIALDSITRRQVRSAGSARAVTAVVGTGDYSAGDRLATFDDLPVVGFVADAPVTRDIGPGTSGPDVGRVAVGPAHQARAHRADRHYHRQQERRLRRGQATQAAVSLPGM